MMKKLTSILFQLTLFFALQCFVGTSTTNSSSNTSSRAAELPVVTANNFLPLTGGSWPSVDPSDSGLFYLRHISRSHERPHLSLRYHLLHTLQPNAPFHLSFRYWASHDLARVRVYLAADKGHKDFFLDKEKTWANAEISIKPAEIGRWTHIELLGTDDFYTLALKNISGNC